MKSHLAITISFTKIKIRILCSTLADRGESILFRSYDMPHDDTPVSIKGRTLLKLNGIENISIKTAAQATSAAPTYFPDVVLKGENGEKVVFWDGGLLNNNPIDQLWRARVDLVGDNDPAPQVACVLSLGASWSFRSPVAWSDKVKKWLRWLRSVPFIGKRISRIMDMSEPALKSIPYLTNTEAKHLDFHRYINRLSRRSGDPDAKTKYFRFNAQTDFEKDTPAEYLSIDLADYKKMEWLADCTQRWMKDKDVAPWADSVAEILAKRFES
jgi:predicted acylesterase/phospholipase RssA